MGLSAPGDVSSGSMPYSSSAGSRAESSSCSLSCRLFNRGGMVVVYKGDRLGRLFPHTVNDRSINSENPGRCHSSGTDIYISAIEDSHSTYNGPKSSVQCSWLYARALKFKPETTPFSTLSRPTSSTSHFSFSLSFNLLVIEGISSRSSLAMNSPISGTD